MTPVQRRMMALAIGLGLVYIALIPWLPYPGSWVLKPLPMLIFAVLMWQVFPGAAGRWLALGYVAAASGDFFLDYGQRDGMFRQALASFLVNQIAFLVAFAKLAAGSPWRWLRATPAIVYSVLLAFWLIPKAGALQVHVSVYIACLLGMVVMACRVEAAPRLLWLGAMLFLLADSLIGVNKFAAPFPNAVLVIVSIYFTGQTLIALGLLRHRAQASPTP
ncbi:lysoplasmalogenase [Arenimonas caeni]|jgi:uncharacterized membrane protein YhhN|uniref:Lysoplasmalogenase n=1 Tax=Arenimonas caeni TaxID=2058085 RepID=A0A2P6M6S5_9GAMM|nr:lysoplasmalogenase [Arenimonas caeni]MDY0022137.1 lysoplasmalogenase [Arenimonas caeni]PRH81676.1 hypothetical protein C6N40_11365 [Arenimonas caeni]